MTVTKIIGSSYLCSKFINHDGTECSDHPIYLFDTDTDNILCVMIVSKTNPFTAHYPDGKDVVFIACSDHRGEFPNKRMFQAEIYVMPKTSLENKSILLSEYRFKTSIYNRELCKALRQAMNFNSIKSVHNYDCASDRTDSLEVLESLKQFLDADYKVPSRYPEQGLVNTSYDEIKKLEIQHQFNGITKKFLVQDTEDNI